MKRETQLEIKKLLMTNVCDCRNSYNIPEAFMIFADREVENEQDLKFAATDFCAFLFEHPEYFNVDSLQDLCFAIPETIMFFHAEIECALDPREKSEFVSAVRELLVNGEKTKTLDVGAGVIPLGSMMLARDNSNISAMDKFRISDGLIQKFNVTPRNEYLTADTDVGGYDMLIGNTPCGATIDMIKAAVNYDRKYFIRFCTCGLPQDKEAQRPAKDWMNQLRAIDPRIRIFTSKSHYRPHEYYGYVGPVPDKEVEKIILSANNIKEPKFGKKLRDIVMEIFHGRKNEG